MIAADLTGGTAAAARLRAASAAIEAGLARTVARLGRDFRQTVEAAALAGQVHARAGGLVRSGVDFRSGHNTLAAIVSVVRETATAPPAGRAGRVAGRQGLRDARNGFGRPFAGRGVRARRQGVRRNLSERAFLRAALAEMEPEIAAALDAAVAAGLRQ